ncbi:MAG TPA: hypothetical protein VGF46_05610 [Gaiellales bacterium]|jgi:hypothetical protein
MSRSMRLGLVGGAVLALVAGIVAVVIVASSGSSSAPLKLQQTVPAATSQFPDPPKGSVVFAREDGADVLALAVLPGAGNGLTLQASDVGEEGTGVRGLHVSFTVGAAGGTRSATAPACGAGCYRTSISLAGRPTSVTMHVQRPGRRTTWAVELPKTWPPTDASAIVSRAARVWEHLKSLSYVDRLGSDATNIVVAHWQIVAPDRLAYQVEGGSSAVIVGTRRWDQPTGGTWVESSSLRLHQPIPFWVSATDAHVLGSGTFEGRAVWHVSFYDPRTPAWFMVSIDKATTRTLDLHMVANAHFMHDSYGQFDAPIKIVPPTSNTK